MELARGPFCTTHREMADEGLAGHIEPGCPQWEDGKCVVVDAVVREASVSGYNLCEGCGKACITCNVFPEGPEIELEEN